MASRQQPVKFIQDNKVGGIIKEFEQNKTSFFYFKIFIIFTNERQIIVSIKKW